MMDDLRRPEGGAGETPASPDALTGGPGDGTSGVMGERLAKVEAAVEHVLRELADLKAEFRAFRTEIRAEIRENRREAKRDFYIAMGFTGTIFAVLAGMMVKGFHWL